MHGKLPPYRQWRQFLLHKWNQDRLKMKLKMTALFDLDGVIIDTEPQYDAFWKKTSEDYALGIEHFERKVKGVTLPEIISTFFSHLPANEQKKIEQDNRDFDSQLDIIPIPGALEFISGLKQNGVKLGLVTSSDDVKLQFVFSRLPIRPYFETIVSANRIKRGKPHPMCYLLAAEDLKTSPENCFVFEDSIHGIRSGNAAGMKVIGLSTTNSEENIRDQVVKVIPHFLNFSVEDFLTLQK